MWCLQDMSHVIEMEDWKTAEETLFHILFLHRLICYGTSQRDHMERETVTKKNSMNISKSSNLSKPHVQDVCCLYRLSGHFVIIKYLLCVEITFSPKACSHKHYRNQQHMKQYGLRGSPRCLSPVCNDQRCVDLCEHSVLASHTPSFPAIRFQHNKYTTAVGKVNLRQSIYLFLS